MVITIQAFLVFMGGVGMSSHAYSIIDSHIEPGVKRSLDVRLEHRVSEETLRAIALELKSQELHNYDRTFITYYLPGMTVGSGAWATSHFDPDLKVKILGLTIEGAEKHAAQPASANEEIIGRWLYQMLDARITIFSEEGKLFMEWKFNDGSSSKSDLVEKQSHMGRRFNWVDTNLGEYCVVSADGNLKLYDNEGFIGTARKY